MGKKKVKKKEERAEKRRAEPVTLVPEPREAPQRPRTCTVVGLGASAGGMEAFQRFFQQMPPASGMAFVVITHLDAHHESLLPELLAKQTGMPVSQVRQPVEIEPDHVYVLAPAGALTVSRGTLVPESSSGLASRAPIDAFFRSLAEDQGENAIGVVLSGAGSDGTLGLMAVKEHGGLTLAQAADTARFDSMPRSAIATGLVDQVLPVEEMPAKLIEYVRHKEALRLLRGPDGVLEDAGGQLNRVLALLKQRTGHDFSRYKKSTLLRRIQRRMQVVQAGSTADYVELLRRDKQEVELLFRDILIGVTFFFRDQEAFELLGREVLPKIFAGKSAEDPVRVWVTACASGEEAYSFAMLLSEHVAGLRHAPRVQIFATDIDDEALDFARAGRYPEGIAEQVPPARLARFFTREGHHYQVNKAVREMVIFSRHNVTRDPPFSRIDLLSCRNLLIYLESELQRKLIELYHYALAPGGYLFLGSSENVVGPPNLYRVVDKKQRIFQRKLVVSPPPIQFPLSEPLRATEVERPRGPQARESNLGQTFERILLEQFAPASVIVDEHAEVQYFCGQTGKYLEPSTGAPSANAINMARKGLRLDLRTALHEAVKHKKQVVHENVLVQTNGGTHAIDLLVRPLHELGEHAHLYIVVFKEAKERSKLGRRRARSSSDRQLTEQLEGELRSTKEHLQTTIEELETSNEELKSSNEELMSMNEELQSANEELQTSKEELQSINEELETVNSELRSKVEEIDVVNSDLQNLLQSTQIATLFLDNDLCIKKFTAATTEVFRLIDSDLGRPITDITPRFAHPELEQELRTVLRTLVSVERKVRMVEREGWCLLHITPYRTLDHVIEGVVMTFVDVTELESSRAQAAQLAAIVSSAPDAIFATTLDGRISTWNRGAERIFGWSASEAIGRNVSMLLPPQLAEQAREGFERLSRGEDIVGLHTERLRKDGSRVEVTLNCSPILASDGGMARVSVIAHESRRLESDLQRANEGLQRANEGLQRANEGLQRANEGLKRANEDMKPK